MWSSKTQLPQGRGPAIQRRKACTRYHPSRKLRSSPLLPRKTECALLYTSGTTGKPKGCVLTNQYFLWSGEWYRRLGGLCELHPGRDCLITPLPMHHMNAMACSSMVMLMTGGCIAPLDRFHPSTWWASVARGGGDHHPLFGRHAGHAAGAGP